MVLRTGRLHDGVVVANPGSVPEIVAAASGLARAGALGRYYVPFASGPRAEPIAHRILPGRLARPLVRELRRRSTPPGVPGGAVRRAATGTELVRVAVARSRLPSSASIGMLRRHSRVFDASVSRQIRAGDRAVLSVAAAARRTLARAAALDLPGFLDCPLAHHRTTVALLREEARLAPQFASTLPSANTIEAMADDLDAELRLAHRVLTLSSFQTRTFVEAGVDPDRIVQIPPGVDVERFAPRPREPDGTFRVLFVGQVTQRKGLSYLLEAFRLARLPASELMIVGQIHGSSRPWAGQAHVRHRPSMPQSELPLLYAAADVFVMPSIIEGSCLTALEAMASGLPVIVSENTGTDDLITEGQQGHIVPIRDADAIAERLRALHASPEHRAGMGRAARTQAERFTWGVYGRRVAEAIGAEWGSGRFAPTSP